MQAEPRLASPRPQRQPRPPQRAPDTPPFLAGLFCKAKLSLVASERAINHYKAEPLGASERRPDKRRRWLGLTSRWSFPRVWLLVLGGACEIRSICLPLFEPFQIVVDGARRLDQPPDTSTAASLSRLLFHAVGVLKFCRWHETLVLSPPTTQLINIRMRGNDNHLVGDEEGSGQIIRAKGPN